MSALQKLNLNVTIPKGKKKAAIWDLFAAFSATSQLQYSEFGRICLNGNRGTFYKLIGKSPYQYALTPEQRREYTDNYSNVTFINGKTEYAPEIKVLYLFVSDYAFKEVI